MSFIDDLLTTKPKVDDYPVIDPQEWSQITSQLEVHHALFYQMWLLGKPIFSRSIPTACVSFDKEGEFIGFTFNPDFWKSLSLEEKKFIICHECLHVFNEHGVRAKDAKDYRAANVAMDVIVNHSLTNSFGFDRSKLPMADKLCWTDTVFADQKDVAQIPTNSSFEYYLNRIPFGSGWDSVDDHSGLGSFDQKSIDKLVDKLKDKLTDEEKQSLSNVAGSGALGKLTTVNPGKVIKKRKWETVIKEWSKQFTKANEDSVEQWARTARRYADLSGDLFIPSEVDHEKFKEGRIQVWFFQDCSGSCIGLKDRFFRAAKSLPEDRFDVKMHTFDDNVYECDLDKNVVYGCGGTSFQCIEEYIQSYIKKHNEKYPKAVFCITDGYGDDVEPEKPENWHWFLSTSCTSYIPVNSYYYELRDFE
jgi:hypothetical protein